MNVSSWNILKTNSVSRIIIQQNLAHLIALILLIYAIFIGDFFPQISLLVMLFSLTMLYLKRNQMIAKAVNKVFTNCIELEIATIKKHKPDIIISQSWGSAVALAMLHNSNNFNFDGPMIILCPVYEKTIKWIHFQDEKLIQEKLKFDKSKYIKNNQNDKLYIIQGTADPVISSKVVEKFCQKNQMFKLRLVDGDNHALKSIVKDESLIKLIHSLTKDDQIKGKR